MAVLDEADQLLRPERLEVPLQLAEHQLDGVIPIHKEVKKGMEYLLWCVLHVVDPAEAEPLHLLRHLLRLVDSEVVHEQADLVVGVGSSQLAQVVHHLVAVHGLLEDLAVFKALLLGDAGQ